MNSKEINYAIVEKTRPPVYTAMKYWGKKPHNVWSEYIKNYVDDKGIVLDPFAGSCVSGIEALKLGKKVVNFDINPLSTFLIDTYLTDFDSKKFLTAMKNILKIVENKKIYLQHYTTQCKECGNKLASIQHFKWENNHIYEFGVECRECNKRYIEKKVGQINKTSGEIETIKLNKWFPEKKFNNSDSYTNAFINSIGGNTFDKIWTRRNLYILSEIFDVILTSGHDFNIKQQLMFAFIQSLHLSSKMCVPRSKSANRDFSTSWGRPAYLCAKKKMEMNPLILFKNNCFGKQSVESAMVDFKKAVGNDIIGLNINDRKLLNIDDIEFDILYGIVDVKDMSQIIPPKTIDFIITDPPYGGLIPYLDLSQIWLVWLEKYNKKYKSNFNNEITINEKNDKSLKSFKKDFTKALLNMKKILKDDGKLILTFNNKNIKIWNSFLKAISDAGFIIEHVIHQPNKRTGIANVGDPYGTSATDFYIRCVKRTKENLETNIESFDDYIINTAIKIINQRNEPTPYQILFNGLLTDFSNTALSLDGFDKNIKEILSERKDIFTIISSKEISGNYWWLKKDFIDADNPLPLSKRLKLCINNLYVKNNNSSYDEVLQVIYKNFPNSLTPDIKIIKKLYNEIFNKKED